MRGPAIPPRRSGWVNKPASASVYSGSTGCASRAVIVAAVAPPADAHVDARPFSPVSATRADGGEGPLHRCEYMLVSWGVRLWRKR